MSIVIPGLALPINAIPINVAAVKELRDLANLIEEGKLTAVAAVAVGGAGEIAQLINPGALTPPLLRGALAITCANFDRALLQGK